jgi:hypothetical protein
MKPQTAEYRRSGIAAGAASLLLAHAALAAGTARTAEAPTPAVWQEHKTSIVYFGLTSTYSCTGIESKIRNILQLLGARKDVTADASACGANGMSMGHSLNVNIRFFSLAPADPASAAPHVMAGWAPVQIAPNHPGFMGDGDCELADQLHELIGKNFSSRNLDYRASCTPYENTLNSYSMHGEFLKLHE